MFELEVGQKYIALNGSVVEIVSMEFLYRQIYIGSDKMRYYKNGTYEACSGIVGFIAQIKGASNGL